MEGISVDKTNQIKQNLEFSIDEDSEAYKDFHRMLSNFLDEHSKQKVDGSIERLTIEEFGYGVTIKIVTLKEDRLQLLEDKAVQE